MNISMALVDYIPVILFLISSIMLQRTLYDRFSKGAFALFAGGTIMVIVAGAFKATWKLLYAAGICDFQKLSQVFFPMQSTGFVLAGIAMLALLFAPQKSGTKLRAAVPPVFGGTMVFVTAMVLGVVCMCGSLAALAKRSGRKGTMVLFLLSILFMLCMGYLSSKDFAQASMNWIAECVNIAGQGCLLAGAIGLKKGLQN